MRMSKSGRAARACGLAAGGALLRLRTALRSNVSRTPEKGNGGPGRTRTYDPRLIKAVL